LEAAGYRLVDPDAKADIYILNTCTVTHVADRNRAISENGASPQSCRRLIAIGCYATERRRN